MNISSSLADYNARKYSSEAESNKRPKCPEFVMSFVFKHRVHSFGGTKAASGPMPCQDRELEVGLSNVDERVKAGRYINLTLD